MKKAFTLSEVLITLTIIGVVAMMTIPTVNNNINDMHFKAAARKAFVVLTDAMSLTALNATSSTVPVDGSSGTAQAWFDTYLSKNLNVMKTCGSGESGCWQSKDFTYGLNKEKVEGSVVGYIGSGALTAILNDGSSINISRNSKADILKYFGVQIYNESGLTLFFDVNGDKGPNILGRDIYAAVLKDDILVPAWSDMSLENINMNCSRRYSGGVSEQIGNTTHSEFTSIAGYSCLNKALIEDMQTHNDE